MIPINNFILYQSNYSFQRYDTMVLFVDRLTLPVVSEEQRECLNAPITREESITTLQ